MKIKLSDALIVGLFAVIALANHMGLEPIAIIAAWAVYVALACTCIVIAKKRSGKKTENNFK